MSAIEHWTWGRGSSGKGSISELLKEVWRLCGERAGEKGEEVRSGTLSFMWTVAGQAQRTIELNPAYRMDLSSSVSMAAVEEHGR